MDSKFIVNGPAQEGAAGRRLAHSIHGVPEARLRWRSQGSCPTTPVVRVRGVLLYLVIVAKGRRTPAETVGAASDAHVEFDRQRGGIV